MWVVIRDDKNKSDAIIKVGKRRASDLVEEWQRENSKDDRLPSITWTVVEGSFGDAEKRLNHLF